MKNIVKYFIENKVLVKVLIATIFLMGIKGILSVPKEGFPSVAINKAVVKTIYPGASSKDVEYNLTVPLEEEILEVDGVDKVESISKDNLSIITVTVDQNESEKYFDQIFFKIKDAVDATQDLPTNLKGKPTVEKLTSFDAPIIEIALSGDENKLRHYAEILQAKLKEIPEVSAVDEVGLPDREVVITINPQRAQERGIDLRAVAFAVRNRNVEGTGGSFITDSKEFKIVAMNRFNSIEELLNTPLRTNDDGSGILLKDVASAKYQDEDRKLSIRNNGSKGISLLIKQKRGSDVLVTMEKIESVIAPYKEIDGLQLSLIGDQARFTKDRLKMVLSNSLIGATIVAIILFLVLDLRSALWTAFGIPFSLIAAFVVFPFLGLTLNALALGGFIIMIGILVDDAIVVSEQIITYKEKGMNPIQAAIEGVHNVWKPVLAATATTVIAFTPLLSFSGLPGKFIWVIPLVVTLVLTASLIESYFFLPTHLLHPLKIEKHQKRNWVKTLEHHYRRLLTKILRHRYLTLLFFVSVLLCSILVAKNFVKKDVFPQDGADTFYIDVTLPAGTTHAQALSWVIPFEQKINELPKEEISGYSLRIGTHSDDSRMNQGSQYNLIKVFIYLSPYGERDRKIQEIMSELEEKTKELTSKDIKILYTLKRIGPPIGHDFEVNVISNDEGIRHKNTASISKFLKELAGVLQVDNDDIIGSPELNFKIDYHRLSSFGLNVQEVVQTLQMTFDGLIISKSVDLHGTLDYRIKVEQQTTDQSKYFRSIPLMNNKGQMVDLSKLVTIERAPSKGEITHLNGKRVTKVFGSVDKKITSPEKVIEKIKREFSQNNEVILHFDGEAVESGKIFKDVKLAAITALLGIYLVLALIFNSFKVPFAVMSAIPFLIVGVVWALFTHGEAMGMFSGMAMVGLMGIVVNDSIVMVDTILKLEGEKALHIDLIIEGAGRRLRAIMLTTLTTICGLFPTAYGLGGYDFFISPMCLAMSWGLLFSTIVVLTLLPCLMAIGLDIKNIFNNKQQFRE